MQVKSGPGSGLVWTELMKSAVKSETPGRSAPGMDFLQFSLGEIPEGRLQ
jgi:hypothetical protein